MLYKVLKAKLHWARVSSKDLNYEGSIVIDEELMRRCGILPYESVLIVNVETGGRFETYAIPGGKGEIKVNGGTARLSEVGDRLIIMAFAWMEPEEARSHRPKVLVLNERNEVVVEK
ncbi:MAG: aspartate 1-decarboxylase [Thermotogae bacterium]|nr:aspartate 1-decarboxylase [Thermotogota bacterium]